jgi:exopolysaccharide/PEP-CTERM locus tyrosine autokinase
MHDRDTTVDRAAQADATAIADDLKRTAAAEAPGRKARAVEIDREHLRRHSIITPDSYRTQIGEDFRRIKRQILSNVPRSRGGLPSNLVLVTSALPGEGKTFCSINLAISMALELDRTVLLVDADVAKPSVPRGLGVKADRGLMDVLLDPGIDLGEVLVRTDISKLSLLPAGRTHPHANELLASDGMRQLLREIAERYSDRIVIFDSPPLLAASEAAVLASQVGQVVIVVEADRTQESALTTAIARLDTANITGVLLNKGQPRGPGYHYGEYGNPAA